MRWFKIIWPAIICIAALVLFTIAVQNDQPLHALWMVAIAIAAGAFSIKGISE